jgi:hypothetical protein
MECCGQPMTKFSYYRKAGDAERVRHYCCVKCGARHHDGINYTADGWFYYINWETQLAHQVRMQAEKDQLLSIHAHELINHSNSEGECHYVPDSAR